MAIVCELTMQKFCNDEEFWSCEIKNQVIPENRNIKLMEKFHIIKKNIDVFGVKFNNCTVTKVPQGLTKIFPNLKVLEIMNSKLKNICKDDLIEYKNLEKFLCGENEIEFLPGDLFEGFEKLELINFHANKLKDIEPNLLDGLTNLKNVNFKNNPKYNKLFSIYHFHKPNATLEEVKNQFFERCCSSVENVKNLVGKYQKEIQDLKKCKENLTKEIQQLRKSASNPPSDMDAEYKNLIQRLQTGIFGDLESFIQDETTKDFCIQIDNREFPVHKFLLAARSPTLAEKFRNNPGIKWLKLVDICADIFEKILKFLYTDDLPRENGTDFLRLYAAAEKLRIDELKNHAKNMLFDKLNDEQVIKILNECGKHGIFELRDEAFDIIKKKYPKIDFKDEWANEPEKLMKIIRNFVKNGGDEI